MKRITLLALIVLGMLPVLTAQPENYTPPVFFEENENDRFQDTLSHNESGEKDGLCTEFELKNKTVYDTDDTGEHLMKGQGRWLVRKQGMYQDGKKEGVWVEWIIVKEPEVKFLKVLEERYENGLYEGQGKSFYLTGAIATEAPFENDEIHGEEIRYSLQGEVTTRLQWVNGKKEGYYREYYPDGSLEMETGYVNDNPEGPLQRFYPSGKIKQKSIYKNGKLNGPGTRYYESGVLQESVTFYNSDFDKTYKYFHPNGQVWIEIVYKKGKRWKIVGNYDINGNPKPKGTLKKGNGTVYYYNEDGSLREYVLIVNGEKVEN